MVEKTRGKKTSEKETEEKEEKQLALKLPKELHLKLKLKCVQEGRAIKDVLIELIEEYLRGH